MFSFCTIKPSDHEMIDHQSEQHHPQLQHPPSQGEAGADNYVWQSIYPLLVAIHHSSTSMLLAIM